MKLINKKFELDTNLNGEITSIKFEGQEILHDGKKWWKKTFPVIWPVVSTSTGFEVEGKDYKVPRHGFWKTLDWDGYVIDGKLTQMAMSLKDDKYPWNMDLTQRIKFVADTIVIETSITNISRRDAYFHFGYHPAFKIDAKSKLDSPAALAINLEGQLTDKYVEQKILMDMAFGKEYDTLVNKDVDFTETSFEANGLKIKIGFDSPNLQVWKPAEAEFVCVEPWWGANDQEDNASSLVTEKKYINKVEPGKTFKATMMINVNKAGK